MLLATDIGNSNLVFGIYSHHKWIHQFRVETSYEKSAEAYALDISDFFLENNIPLSNINSLVLSSVVPPLTSILKNALSQLFFQETLVIGPEIYPKLKLAIERPHEIGSDLVANAIAGYEKCGQACIIVDFGTALTFTTVSNEGQILGVAIAPGLKTAMYSLFKSTAQLPVVPLEMPESAIGKNTVTALQAGVLWGYIGLVESLVNRIQKELNEKCFVLATGGLSSVIPELRTVFDEIDPNLTLDGLRLIAEKYV
jgi:type III pantothenate kinase